MNNHLILCRSLGTVSCSPGYLGNTNWRCDNILRTTILCCVGGPVPFGTCICSNVETILSWTCHVYGPFEFQTSLGTSILLVGHGVPPHVGLFTKAIKYVNIKKFYRLLSHMVLDIWAVIWQCESNLWVIGYHIVFTWYRLPGQQKIVS